MKYPLFSSESVCAGHPDKVCDQISDAVVDNAIAFDRNSRVAVETLVTVNRIVMAGEVSCKEEIDYGAIARKKVRELGYLNKELSFDNGSEVEVYIHQQSGDIALGVDNGGAGDQGMMFGYATDETSELMPLPITLASDICRRMDEMALIYQWMRPDGKAQVTVRYEKNRPSGIEKVVLARPINYKECAMEEEDIKNFFYENVVEATLAKYDFKVNKTKVILNGTGRWEVGGPASDTGVTGRKIVVDTYGGMGRIGGGCFSGKDPTKVDRSAAYAARFIAKNIVAAKLAKRCEVQLAYAIGQKYPVCKALELFGSEMAVLGVIEDFAWKLIDLSVDGIIERLELKRPIYGNTAKYGHFGNGSYPWEQIV